MIVPDAAFVRRLRTRVRATPEAGERRQRVGTPWHRRQLTLVRLRCLVPLAVGVVCVAWMEPAIPGVLLLAWTLMVTLMRAQQIANALSRSAELSVFYQLPVSNADVARHQQSVIWRSSFWLGADWLVFACFWAGHHSSAAAWLVAPVLIVAQWATALAIAVGLVCWNPRFPYGGLVALFGIGGWIGLQVAKAYHFTDIVLAAIRQGLERFSPAGLLLRAAEAAVSGSVLAWIVLPAVIVAAWLLVRLGVTHLRERFALEPLFHYDDRDPDKSAVQWTRAEPLPLSGNVAQTDDEAEPLPPAEPAAPVDLPALRAALRAELDQPPGLALYRLGWVEGLIARRLSPRQRLVVDFLQPQSLGWMRAWLMALGCVTVAHLMLVVGVKGGVPGTLALGGVLLFAVPLFGGSWAGGTVAISHQACIASHALLPLGFWELAGVRLLLTALRCVLALPLFYLMAAFGFTAAPLPWPEALAWALRALVVFLAVQPIWVFLSFSAHTNDASSHWWFTSAIIFALLFGLALLFGILGALAAGLGPVGETVGGLLLLGYTHTALLLYGLAYNRAVFDVIGRPPTP